MEVTIAVTVTLTKRLEAKPKMLRFLLGVTRMTQVEWFGDKVRGAMLRWFGHSRKFSGYIQ